VVFVVLVATDANALPGIFRIWWTAGGCAGRLGFRGQGQVDILAKERLTVHVESETHGFEVIAVLFRESRGYVVDAGEAAHAECVLSKPISQDLMKSGQLCLTASAKPTTGW
jgi:uncharacterized protein with LGFP repeats